MGVIPELEDERGNPLMYIETSTGASAIIALTVNDSERLFHSSVFR